MPELTIMAAAGYRPPDPLPPEELQGLRAGLSRSGARRMTLPALMVRKALAELGDPKVETLVYQTGNSELRALETYIEGYPEPSPLHFQSSIHPSGVEQVFIEWKRPLPRFFPLANYGGPVPGLRTLHALGGAGILILLEERGGWTTEYGLSPDFSFVLAFQLQAEGAGVGRLRWEADAPAGSLAVTHGLVEAVLERRGWRAEGVELHWA